MKIIKHSILALMLGLGLIAQHAQAQSYASSGQTYKTGSGGYSTGSGRVYSDGQYNAARNTDRFLNVMKRSSELSINRSYSNEISRFAMRDSATIGVPKTSFRKSLSSGESKNEAGYFGGLTDSIYKLWQKWGGYDVHP